MRRRLIMIGVGGIVLIIIIVNVASHHSTPKAATTPAATHTAQTHAPTPTPTHAVAHTAAPTTSPATSAAVTACTRQTQAWLNSPLQQVPGTVKNAIGDINQDAGFYIQYPGGGQVFLHTIGDMVTYLTQINMVPNIPACADPNQLYGYYVPTPSYLGDADTLSTDVPGESQTLADAHTVQSDYQALQRELSVNAPGARL